MVRPPNPARDVALFGKGAAPALRTVSDGDVPWTPLDDEQEDEGGNEEERGEAKVGGRHHGPRRGL